MAGDRRAADLRRELNSVEVEQVLFHRQKVPGRPSPLSRAIRRQRSE
jgi:hypothetical protein